MTSTQPQGIYCSPGRAIECSRTRFFTAFHGQPKATAPHSERAQEWLASDTLRGARDFAGQRKSYIFQRLVGVPPRGIDVAVSQGALHVGYRHAGA